MDGADPIPLHKPQLGPEEQHAMAACLDGGHLAGDGPYCRQAETLLHELTGARHVMLTTSATAALELAFASLGVGAGDEVICPSFTFPSAANAILLHGATPIFADLDEDTLLLDPEDVARVVTPRTRAILPVDYGSVGTSVTELLSPCPRKDLVVIEDAAHCIDAWRDGRHVGTDADAAALSFHATKNITCGEGGALLLKDDAAAARAEIMREKGTNRNRFERGEVDHYEWVDVGTSGTMSDLLAAVLVEQLRKLKDFTRARRAIAARYDDAFTELYERGLLRPQHVPASCQHNGHIYSVRARDQAAQRSLRKHLASRGIEASFHFVPLHTTAFAQRRLGPQRELPVSVRAGKTLLRLPIYPGLTEEQQQRVVAGVVEWGQGG